MTSQHTHNRLFSESLRRDHSSYRERKERVRQNLSADIERFLESGGEVQEVEKGVSGLTVDARTKGGTWSNGYKAMPEQHRKG